jgi:hypothetical protein
MVQHDVSMMRTNLLAGIAVLLMATSAADAEDLDWGRLHAETVALYGECDFDVSIAGRERLRVISHCTKDGRTTFAADDYLRFTEYKNRQLHPEGIKICPRPVRVDDVERVDRRTFTVFTRCEETSTTTKTSEKENVATLSDCTWSHSAVLLARLHGHHMVLVQCLIRPN